jgi:predicted DNA binding CopG/RHH family protein
MKAGFAALAASRGLSESKLLGLMIDSVLARNPMSPAVEEHHGRQGRRNNISIRLRPGDRELLRLRARARGMNYTTYAAVLIRAHLRTNPPLPLEELARLERSLAEVSAIAGGLGQIARAMTDGQGVDPRLSLELVAVLPPVERLWQQIREVVRANVISWEAGDGEATS